MTLSELPLHTSAVVESVQDLHANDAIARRLLEDARSVDEAVELARSARVYARLHLAMADAFIADLCERVRAAGANGTALRVRSGGTKDFYGQSLEGEVLETAAWRGIVSYEPTELVITALAGTPIAADCTAASSWRV